MPKRKCYADIGGDGIDGDFAYIIHLRYPGLDRRQGLQKLMDEHGSIRAIHRATGIPLVSLSRWCNRVGVYNKTRPPPGFQFTRITDKLIRKEGDDPREKLGEMYRREGSWIGVAVKLEVTEAELKQYRYSLGMVPKAVFNERVETTGKNKEAKFDEGREQWESYYGW